MFRRTVRVMIDSGRRTMEQAGVTADDIALVVPHQANIRMIESANAKLGLPMERTAVVLDRTGNTSSASIPRARRRGRPRARVAGRPHPVRRLRRGDDMGIGAGQVGSVSEQSEHTTGVRPPGSRRWMGFGGAAAVET